MELGLDNDTQIETFFLQPMCGLMTQSEQVDV